MNISDRKYQRLGVAPLFLALCILLAGCVKKEVAVRFDIPATADRPITLVYYASDKAKGFVRETVVAPQKGKAEATLPSVNPMLVYLFQTGASATKAIFYAERGDQISVTGSEADPLGWKISGNNITEALTEWRLSSQKGLALQAADPEKGGAEVNRLVAAQVTGHPSEPASALILYCYYNRRIDEPGYHSLCAKLTGEAAEPKWAELAARADQSVEMPGDQLTEPMFLNVPYRGCDTISPGKLPMLLLFAEFRGSDREKHIARLRSLAKAFPDSSKRIIVEISSEPDSMSRMRAMRNDSIKGVVRAWMPLGVSDSLAMRLGVSRFPFAIVADRNGREQYRGSDFEKADSLFRRVAAP